MDKPQINKHLCASLIDASFIDAGNFSVFSQWWYYSVDCDGWFLVILEELIIYKCATSKCLGIVIITKTL